MSECCICESYRDSAFGCDGCGLEVCPDCRLETEVRVLCDKCFNAELEAGAPDVQRHHDDAVAWLADNEWDESPPADHPVIGPNPAQDEPTAWAIHCCECSGIAFTMTCDRGDAQEDADLETAATGRKHGISAFAAPAAVTPCRCDGEAT